MISRIPTRLKVNAGPAYNSSNWVRRRLSSDIITVIDVCLEENETRRLEGWGKQQLREVDIHEKILRAGHCISYTIVREYIRIGKLQVRETFIRQGNGEGSICEFDWAEVKIKIGGIYRR